MGTEADEIWTSAETAKRLRTPVATLRWWRHTGSGPRSFKLGAKRVMYRRSDVEAWLDAQYNASTGDGAA